LGVDFLTVFSLLMATRIHVRMAKVDADCLFSRDNHCASDRLAEPHMRALSSKNLPTGLGAACLFVAVCAWAPSAAAQSLVSNGTFDAAYAPWWGHAAENEADPTLSASQTLAALDGQFCSTIEAGGQNVWDVILGLSDLVLVAGQHYRISFSASADAERSIRFKTGLGDAPYTDYFLKTIALTTTPQVFDYTYLNLRADDAAHFQFHIGGSPGVVCVDNVIVEPVVAPQLPAHVSPSLTGHPLKAHAAVVKMGTAVDTPTFLSAPRHNAIVAGEFSMITPANSMKMNIIQPTEGVFDFVETDALLAFANENGLEFHGHPLVWHTQAPAWLIDGTYDRDQMIAVMYAHIDSLTQRYPTLPYWDVVNEAIEQVDNVWTFRPTIWHDRIGPDFIDLAFQRARMNAPTAKLLYNDYNIEQMGNAKADRVFELVNDMKTRGIPIDQVGFQSHYYAASDGGTSGVPDIAAIRANMDRYAAIGVDVQITECDFRIGAPFSAEKQALQDKFFADLLQTCIDAPNCAHYTVWGLSDFDSWVPSTFPDYDFAHIFDRSFVAKSSYHALTTVFAKYALDGTPVVVAVDDDTTVTESSEEDTPRGSSGCAVSGARGGGAGPWFAALFAGLGLAFAVRSASKRARHA
jgi:endo-1,4-beta-xylanase